MGYLIVIVDDIEYDFGDCCLTSGGSAELIQLHLCGVNLPGMIIDYQYLCMVKVKLVKKQNKKCY